MRMMELEVQQKKPVTKLSNFREHAAYTTDVWGDDKRGWCPESHPYPIPRLDLETRYDLQPMRNLLGANVVNNVSNWRLSTGDASGAGGHADFVSVVGHTSCCRIFYCQLYQW